MPAVFVRGAIHLGAASSATSGLPCTAWLPRMFFQVAEAADVSHCLAAEADPRALVGDPWNGRNQIIDRLLNLADQKPTSEEAGTSTRARYAIAPASPSTAL